MVSDEIFRALEFVELCIYCFLIVAGICVICDSAYKLSNFVGILETVEYPAIPYMLAMGISFACLVLFGKRAWDISKSIWTT